MQKQGENMFTITQDEEGYAVYAAGHLVGRFNSLDEARVCVEEIARDLGDLVS